MRRLEGSAQGLGPTSASIAITSLCDVRHRHANRPSCCHRHNMHERGFVTSSRACWLAARPTMIRRRRGSTSLLGRRIAAAGRHLGWTAWNPRQRGETRRLVGIWRRARRVVGLEEETELPQLRLACTGHDAQPHIQAVEFIRTVDERVPQTSLAKADRYWVALLFPRRRNTHMCR